MTELTEEEKKLRVLEAVMSTNHIVSESKKLERELALKTTKNVMEKFQRIEQKERCIRVKFLDWLSAKLASWSVSVHEMSVRIDSPCVIRLPETKKSKRAKLASWNIVGKKQ